MAKKRREGRGHLHTIDTLPAVADEATQWAAAELMARDLTQKEILLEYNRRLAEVGVKPISRSSFNRYSVRKAVTSRALIETREVAAAVVEKLGPDKADHVTILIVELIKTAAYDLLVGGGMSAKELQSLARALDAAQRAERVSNDNRKVKEEDQAKRTRDMLDTASEVAADKLVEKDPTKKKEEVLATIRQAYLGEAA
jgi:ribosomal silencing factor RsfS